MKRWNLLALLTTLLTVQHSTAAGKTMRDLADRIDRAVDVKLKKEKLTASPGASDAEFLRRVSLDICGIIPSAERAKAFLDSTDPDKRSKLIDELLASPEYGKRMADVWQPLLLPPPAPIIHYHPALFGQWLVDSFNANKPWDRMVRELLTAQAGTEDTNPAVILFQANESIDKMTDTVTKAFLGVQVQCAQCHNHPYADWKRTEYWGIASFFLKTRTQNNKAVKNGPPIVDEWPQITARRFLPESVQFVPPRFLKGEAPPLLAREPLRPALAGWMTTSKNPYFAKAMVNRVWGILFGRGLAHPIDDIGDANPPSHPELLDQLAAGFAANEFDVKELIRAITSSQTYQRSSKPSSNNEESDPTLLARMPVKMLSPEMLYDSLVRIAVPVEPPLARGQKPSKYTPRQQFVQFFHPEGAPESTNYAHGIPQVLRLMNSAQFHRSARLDDLIRGSKPEEIIERLYLTVLSRRPTAEETAKLLKYARQGETRRNYLDIAWTLINTSEFALNH